MKSHRTLPSTGRPGALLLGEAAAAGMGAEASFW